MPSNSGVDARDLHRSQRMEIILSPITATPETQLKEVEEGNKRVRNSLVAKNLSGEAPHALEWTIEMVLRDSDTLMVIYAINQNTVEDGGKIFPDDRIAGKLSSQAAPIGTSLTPINIPHIPRTASPLSNIGDISERGRERK
ncbi:hypothetical protein B9Z19DRAFT_1128747 [Tuber borchii]|uniref:Uncharacterized protein n=1 Tax=Tuber borchii TaxID=42251 RepID=A0A2T6ZNS2_TUBBO|nr:hypothetical protein B9Z19DRAFT_1128747 [Tuber borchii]